MNDFDMERHEQEELERYRDERHKTQFAQCKPVDTEILEKMDAKRLLKYYQKWRNWNHSPDWDDTPVNPYISQHIRTIKQILETKPHIERPGKPKKEKKDSNKRRK